MPKLTALMAALVLPLASSARADTDVIRAASALVMIESAQAKEDAQGLTSGLEMLSRLDLTGEIDDLVATYIAEARFFARNNLETLERLDNLAIVSATGEYHIAIMTVRDSLEVPDGKTISAVSFVPAGVAALATEQGKAVCRSFHPGTILTCDPASSMGVLVIEPIDRSLPRIAIMRLESGP